MVEYKVEFRAAVPRESQLNDWANEGWRLVTIIEDKRGDSTRPTYAIYLERAKSKTQ